MHFSNWTYKCLSHSGVAPRFFSAWNDVLTALFIRLITQQPPICSYPIMIVSVAFTVFQWVFNQEEMFWRSWLTWHECVQSAVMSNDDSDALLNRHYIIGYFLPASNIMYYCLPIVTTSFPQIPSTYHFHQCCQSGIITQIVCRPPPATTIH